VAEKTPEEMAAEEKPAEEPKPAAEEMAEVPVVPTVETPAEEVEPEGDRVAKLESSMEELKEMVGKLKGDIETPSSEEVAVAMSDNRPLWKRISDGIDVMKKHK
jgi:hypothetical protein